MNLLLATITALSLTGCSLLNGGDELPVKEVPSVVQNSFSQAFPDATNIEWEKSKKNFEVEFDKGTTELTALFDASGSLLMEKQQLTADALPEPVSQNLQEQYATYQIEDVEEVKSAGETFYQLELESGNKEEHLVYTSEGEVTNKISYWD